MHESPCEVLPVVAKIKQQAEELGIACVQFQKEQSLPAVAPYTHG